MKVVFPYGKDAISANLPDSLLASATVDILRPSYPLKEWDPSSLHFILENPIAAPPFSQFISGADSLLIVVSDHTRPVLYPRWLPQVVSFALALRPNLKISFLVATGTHSPESVLLDEILPPSLSERFPVFIHSADPGGPSATQFVHLGRTSRGTPVVVNRLLADAERILSTGAVNFHYYAGFTGGRKSLIPGCAARQTIEANHSLLLSPTPGRGRHPQARSALLALNPVSEDLAEAVSFLSPPIFLINAIVSPDFRLLALVAGDLHRAHRFAASLVFTWGSIPVSHPYDLVIASAGGHPHDISYYQTHKAFDALHRIVSPHGRLILLARMPHGIGDPALLSALQTASTSALESHLRSAFDHAVHIAFSHRLKLASTPLCLVSDLPAETARSLGALSAPDLSAALASLNGFRPRSVAIVPSAAGIHFTGVAARL